MRNGDDVTVPEGLSKQDPAIFTDWGNFSTLRANLMYGSESALKQLGSPQQIDEHLLSILESINVKEHFTGIESALSVQ